MTQLSVNINKLATLRNSRGGKNPDVVTWAREIEDMGVFGITVHPRPDERQIRFQDVRDLSKVVRGELNIEGYPDENWLRLVEETRPDQATLVPDPPDALTSNAGFHVPKSVQLLATVVERLSRIPTRYRGVATRVSVFIDPFDFTAEDATTLKDLGVNRIELYTEKFAQSFQTPNRKEILEVYKSAAQWARENRLEVNAGHDLTYENLPVLLQEIPWIAEVSIGHALICDALTFGMKETVARYLASTKVLNSLSVDSVR